MNNPQSNQLNGRLLALKAAVDEILETGSTRQKIVIQQLLEVAAKKMCEARNDR